MVGILNRVGMAISTTGQGTVTANTVIDNRFLTPAEAGAVDGESYYWLLQEGLDFELFTGEWTLSGTTISRDAVHVSKIAGVFGTTKMILAGNAQLRSVAPAEFLSALVRADEAQTFDATQKAQARENIGISDELPLSEHATAPATPASGKVTTYYKTDGKPYSKDDTGTERPLLTQGRQMMPLKASACDARGTNGATKFGPTELATNDVMLSGYSFSASVEQAIQFSFIPPKQIQEGTFTARFHWTGQSGSGNAIWGCRARAIGNDEAHDGSWGTAVTVTDGFLAANDEHVTSETTAITPSNTWAEGDKLIIEFYRDADSGSDTYSAAAILTDIELFFTTNAENDA